MRDLKALLEEHYAIHNTACALSAENPLLLYPDPLYVLKPYTHYPRYNPYIAEIALICALLSYGNAKCIVKALQQCDWHLLESLSAIKASDEALFPYYRFQTSADIKAIFVIVAMLLENGGLYKHFLRAYYDASIISESWRLSDNTHHARMLYAIYTCIQILYQYIESEGLVLSKGLHFMLGISYRAHLEAKGTLPSSASALKRWNMLLRWLVRKDNIDMGIWNELSPSALILPLDTHTFTLCRRLKILNTRVYNLQSALKATDTLAQMFPQDPVKYDFALYRLGQSGDYKALFI